MSNKRKKKKISVVEFMDRMDNIDFEVEYGAYRKDDEE